MTIAYASLLSIRTIHETKASKKQRVKNALRTVKPAEYWDILKICRTSSIENP